MARVKRGIVTKSKHKKLLKANKGYRGSKSKLVRVAREAYLHAGRYAYHGRKLKKRTTRAGWNLKIGEAVKKEGLSYSKFIKGLKEAKIALDRKMLSELIVSEPQVFTNIVSKAKEFFATPSK